MPHPDIGGEGEGGESLSHILKQKMGAMHVTILFVVPPEHQIGIPYYNLISKFNKVWVEKYT